MHRFHSTLLAALIAAVAATPALAKDKDKHGHKPSHVQKHEGKRADRHARADHDRHHARDRYRADDLYDRRNGDRYRSYSRNSYAGCPPGLAKKGNGCLPPGQAKKLAVGQPLPPGAVYRIPRHVRAELPPPPPGYRYAVVHNQVVLVSRHDLVVDIIRTLLG